MVFNIHIRGGLGSNGTNFIIFSRVVVVFVIAVVVFVIAVVFVVAVIVKQELEA